MYDYRESIERESGLEDLSRGLCIKSVPTKQLKIYQSWLCKTSIQLLFAFILLFFFGILSYLNEKDICHYLWGSFEWLYSLKVW